MSLTGNELNLTLELEAQDSQIATLKSCYAVAIKVAERLRDENEALRAKLRWIPVTERLPEIHDMYLVIVNNDYHEFMYFVPKSEDRSEYWYTSGGEAYGITHWMPLPDAPDKEPKS